MCASSPGQEAGGRNDVRHQAHDGGRNLLVNFDGARGNADAVFADRRPRGKADASGQFAELELAAHADAQEVLRALVTRGPPVSLELAEPSLTRSSSTSSGPMQRLLRTRPEVASAVGSWP